VVIPKEGHDLGDTLEICNLGGEALDLGEKHWTLGSSTHALKPCLLIVVTMELDMFHLE
jgi:hypothetical protein